MRLGTWDRGLELDSLVRRLLAVRERCLSRNSLKCVAYVDILLIQAFNGLRISEAIECSLKWVESGVREVGVRVAKKKRETHRLCIIPPVLTNKDRDVLRILATTDPSVIKRRIKSYAINRLGFNTHSIRYAWIAYMLENGVDPITISKTLKHSRVETLLEYARALRYDSILTPLFKSKTGS